MANCAFYFVLACLVTWLTAAARYFTTVTATRAGFLEDAVFAFGLFLTLIAARSLFAKRPRLSNGICLLLLLSWCVVLLSNTVFFHFFESYLNLESGKMILVAEKAASSIFSEITVIKVFAFLVFPLGLYCVVLRKCPPRIATKSGVRRHAALSLSFVFLAYGVSTLQFPAEVSADRSPGMHILKQGVKAVRAPFSRPHGLTRVQLAYETKKFLDRGMDLNFQNAARPDRPLLQIPNEVGETSHSGKSGAAQQKLNVMIILMESVRGAESFVSPTSVPITPFLNELREQSLSFDNFYANEMRTVNGEFATLCAALPNWGGTPIYVDAPRLKISCLPEILKNEGYQTYWISAYSSDYSNKAGFLKMHGIEHIVDQTHFGKPDFGKGRVGWGLGDLAMFERSVDVIDKAQEPFFAEIMTLSNHHPFNHEYGIEFPQAITQLPENEHYRNYLKGLYYTDHSIAHFFSKIRNKPWFKNTVFLILGDHGIRTYPNPKKGQEQSPIVQSEIYYRNQLIVYSPAHIQPKHSSLVGSQIDVAPTVLDLLKIYRPNSFLGVSLLAPIPENHRTAVMLMGNNFNVRRGNRYCYAAGYSCFEKMFPECKEGEKPTFTGYTCFETSDDLIKSKDPKMTYLSEAEKNESVEGVTLLLKLNNSLIEGNAF